MVVELGEGVTDLRSATTWSFAGCRSAATCRYCRAGPPWQCEKVANVVAPGRPVRRHLAPAMAATCSTTTSACPRSPNGSSSRASRRDQVRNDAPLDVVAVVGCAVATGVGAVLNTAAVARTHGRRDRLRRRRALRRSRARGSRRRRRIVACDLNPAKLEVAKRVGATETRRGRALGAERPRLRLRRDRPASPTTEQAIGRSALGGAAVIVGLPPAGQTAPLRPARARRGRPAHPRLQLRLDRSPARHPVDHRSLQGRELDLDSLISGRRPLEQAAEALEDLAAGRTLRTLLTMEDGGL